MVAFDARGRVIAVNDAASQIFESREGLTLINGRLHSMDPATHAGL